MGDSFLLQDLLDSPEVAIVQCRAGHSVQVLQAHSVFGSPTHPVEHATSLSSLRLWDKS